MKESAILAPLNETYLRPDLASLQSQPWHNADWVGNGATRRIVMELDGHACINAMKGIHNVDGYSMHPLMEWRIYITLMEARDRCPMELDGRIVGCQLARHRSAVGKFEDETRG